MNILMVSPDPVPKRTGTESFEKSEIYRIIEENRNLRLFLAKEFSSLGANVLLIEPKFSYEKPKTAMEFYQEDGISRVSVWISQKPSQRFFSPKDILRFCAAVSDNSACLGGIFTPDIVISGGSFCFGTGAASKIAEESSSVLITELFCDAPHILIKLGLCSGLNPVLSLIKKAASLAFDKSEAVLGFFSGAQKCFSGARGLFLMDTPAPDIPKKLSPAGFSAYEKLSAFREGGNFVLACTLPLEEGFSLEELITASFGFGSRFSLVFLSGGTKLRRYKAFVAEKGITNVFFLEDSPKEELPLILSAADAVFASENSLIKGFAPQQSFFYTAMLSKKPVLAAAEEWSGFLRKSSGAIIAKPHNKESLRLGIKALLEMSETDRESIGLSAAAFCEKNSQKIFAKEYFSLLDNLVKQKEKQK